MRELVTFTAVAVFVGAANMAAAADLGRVHDRDMGDPTPMPVRLSNWTGFYIGGGVGGVMFTTTDTGTATDPIGLNETTDFGSSGFMGTLQAGYDVQFPMSRWVAGLFVDVDWTSAEAQRTAGHPITHTIDTWRSVSLDGEWSVGGRVGYLFWPETLIYGLGAYTSQSVSVSGHTDLVRIDGSFESSGLSVGAGIETQLQDNWTVKFEYRYTQSDDYNLNNVRISESLDTQSARVVFTYKFNRW